jgi:hypothetical protein
MSTVTPAGDHPMLEQLEDTVRAELVLAESGQQEPEAEGVPTAEQQLPDPDAERYEAALGALLGAVEALEQKSRPGDLPPEGG